MSSSAHPSPSPSVSSDQILPKVDPIKDKSNLTPSQLNYMRLAQAQNAQRVLKLKKLRRSNLLVAGSLGLSVVGIFGYSIWAVGSGLTRSILNLNPDKVIVIEKDRRFRSAMDLLNECSDGRVEAGPFHWGDVLSFNMSQLLNPNPSTPGELEGQDGQEQRSSWTDPPPNIRIIGNLPFNVSTPLIVRWLKDISLCQNAWTHGRVPLVLTFQEEVAQRLVAEPSDSQRCRLSVMAQVWADVQHCFTIPGSAFVPKPDVNVGVVKFVPKKVPLISHPFELVEKVVRHIFSMRRKTVKYPIGTLFPEIIRPELTERILEMTQVHPDSRPFQLTNEEFGRFCDAYAELTVRYPILNDYNYRGHKPNEIWEEVYAESPQFHCLQIDQSNAKDEKLKGQQQQQNTSIPQGTLLRIIDEDSSLGLPQ